MAMLPIRHEGKSLQPDFEVAFQREWSRTAELPAHHHALKGPALAAKTAES